jgi:uncharacterized protein (DUF2132 family)
MFGFSTHELEDRVLKEQVNPFYGFSPRQAMQLLGTEYGRNMLRDDIWIKCAEREITANIVRGQGTIITDVRFTNEATWLRSQRNSALIRIVVPNLKREGVKFEHASELGIPSQQDDIVIINNHDGLENLRQAVIDAMHEIICRQT